MHTVWVQRREEVLSDCLVSPDVFHRMVDQGVVLSAVSSVLALNA